VVEFLLQPEFFPLLAEILEGDRAKILVESPARLAPDLLGDAMGVELAGFFVLLAFTGAVDQGTAVTDSISVTANFST
jgi:hypothetical protein